MAHTMHDTTDAVECKTEQGVLVVKTWYLKRI